ncbi:hypothetical protein MGYG_01455 [Nannizzia gypsea CBS 118893]|uniref:Uncharacterized protein n=1 Tax=Arthroderma gypseum (strain ATCC MYA-4604 / CBS 118893) TaxID=535722 RepID=E5R0Y4_ARTGP|nr:hypothetical protein MGYG_01455 [Nannizzia gypsea CBS 118893]EFQ98426.1 hypothetical protein MGYG_01455 [Nannizzia gypsea CBS 118893]
MALPPPKYPHREERKRASQPGRMTQRAICQIPVRNNGRKTVLITTKRLDIKRQGHRACVHAVGEIPQLLSLDDRPPPKPARCRFIALQDSSSTGTRTHDTMRWEEYERLKNGHSRPP